MHKVKVKGQAVQKLEWKQTDGQSDGQDRIFTFVANAVGKKFKNLRILLFTGDFNGLGRALGPVLL